PPSPVIYTLSLHDALPISGGADQFRRMRQPLIPFPGEPREREFGRGRRIDREDRQEQDRQVQETDVDEGIGGQPAAARQKPKPGRRLHRASLTARRMTSTAAPAISVTTNMVVTDSAAPKGQLAALPNWTWMALAIMTPSFPPTSLGVT